MFSFVRNGCTTVYREQMVLIKRQGGTQTGTVNRSPMVWRWLQKCILVETYRYQWLWDVGKEGEGLVRVPRLIVLFCN